MRLALISTFALLVACAAPAVPVWLQPGTRTTTASADLGACRAEARARAPARIGPTVTVTVGVGVRRCVGAVCVGASDGLRPLNRPARTTPRDQALAACMGRKGYALVTLPGCPRAAMPLDRHPFDTRGICVVDGTPAALR